MSSAMSDAAMRGARLVRNVSVGVAWTKSGKAGTARMRAASCEQGWTRRVEQGVKTPLIVADAARSDCTGRTVCNAGMLDSVI